MTVVVYMGMTAARRRRYRARFCWPAGPGFAAETRRFGCVRGALNAAPTRRPRVGTLRTTFPIWSQKIDGGPRYPQSLADVIAHSRAPGRQLKPLLKVISKLVWMLPNDPLRLETQKENQR